ncbi:MAG: hypothetical protein Q7T20_01725 [Saprospiraceae bacterium]|nr:hypothetical protein [Saprospiraceae bacterium]
MKKFFQLALLLAGLGWLAEPCLAQNLEAHFRATFAALDKSQISSGIPDAADSRLPRHLFRSLNRVANIILDSASNKIPL